MSVDLPGVCLQRRGLPPVEGGRSVASRGGVCLQTGNICLQKGAWPTPFRELTDATKTFPSLAVSNDDVQVILLHRFAIFQADTHLLWPIHSFSYHRSV